MTGFSCQTSAAARPTPGTEALLSLRCTRCGQWSPRRDVGGFRWPLRVPVFVPWLFLMKRSTGMKLLHHKEAGLRRALTLDLKRRLLPPLPSAKTVAKPDLDEVIVRLKEGGGALSTL